MAARSGGHGIWCFKLHVHVMAMLAASKLTTVSSKAVLAPLMRIVNSPAANVEEGRQRGPFVLERLRKQEQEQEEAEAAAAARAAKALACSLFQGAIRRMVLECLGGARACCEECRVRIGRHCLPGMMARKQTLIEKVGSRPMSAMVAISPAGMGSLDKTPDRDDCPAGETGHVA